MVCWNGLVNFSFSIEFCRAELRETFIDVVLIFIFVVTLIYNSKLSLNK